MEPSTTHGIVLPQQALTRSAGGCPSGPRPEDLMQGGHEGANPHAGQRVAINTDDQSMNMDPITLTKLDIYKILVEKARLYGSKHRPVDLEMNERSLIVLNALYPTGIPYNVDIYNKSFKDSISKFISKCENLYNDSKKNMKRFCKKNEKWLATIFDTEIPKSKIENSPREINKNIDSFPSHCPVSPQKSEPSGMGSVSDMLLAEPIPETSYETPSTSHIVSNRQDDSIPGISYDTTFSSNEKSSRQMCRIRKSIEESLQNQPQSKIIKMMSKIVTDEIGGEKLNKSSAQGLEFVLNECLKSPTRPKKIATSIKVKVESKPYTPDEALSFVIDRKLTVEDYTFIQKDLKERGFLAYPPYYKLKNAKKMCYPEEDIVITEREASVSFHSLLLHTFRRIIKLTTERISQYCKQNQKNIIYCTFEGSWGFDGSTGQSFYKQKFLDGDDQNENCLFTTSYIPLQIKTSDGFVLWSNPSPQSYRFCRPLKIQYRNETKELILEEKMRVEAEINQFTSLYAETDEGQSIISDPKLYLTTIDGKVFNAITGTTSQLRCACCGATVTEFNKLDVVMNKPVNPETLRHGLSPLHAWIRIFEFLLHLGYKNDPAVMKWRVSKESPEATIVEERRKKIQYEIRDKMSLLVDVVRPNSGTTNDGNTARTALSDQHRKTFADILGIEKWLLDDLQTILVALSSGLKIDAAKFDDFCKSLATKYVEKYNWFYMSVTMHKILMHGQQIIDASTLPIGMLSEQAGESRNKYWRYDRQHHTRKLDRKTTILDLFHRALESSDPYISSLTFVKRDKYKKSLPLPKSVLQLLCVTTDNVHYNKLDSEEFEANDITLTTDEIVIQSDSEDMS